MEHFRIVVVFIALAIAAIVDGQTKKIPNWFSGPLAVIGIYFCWIFTPQQMGNNTIIAVVFIFLGMFSVIGAGDAKLLSGITYMVGWKTTLSLAIIGLVTLFLYAVVKYKEKAISAMIGGLTIALIRKKAPVGTIYIPYSPFLLFGMIITTAWRVVT